jgi:methylamine---glutamate N-methyltransferase subunit C
VENFLRSMVMEIQMLARACGKADVHDLEPEDLRALTLETALITQIPMVGMDSVPWAFAGLPDSNGHR